MSSGVIPQILSGFAARLPIILICMVGGIFVIARWKSLGKAALPAVLGLAVTILVSLVTAVIYPLLPGFLEGRLNLQQAFMIVGIIQNLFSTVALGLIILAVFLGRPKQPA